MERHAQQRVSQSAADEHDLDAGPSESLDGLDRAGRKRVDVGSRERVDLLAARANGVQAKTVDFLEGNASLHGVAGQIADAAGDDVTAAGGEPVDAFDPAYRRIDVEDNGLKCRGRRISHATSR